MHANLFLRRARPCARPIAAGLASFCLLSVSAIAGALPDSDASATPTTPAAVSSARVEQDAGVFTAAPHGLRGFAARLVSQTLAGSPTQTKQPPPVLDPVLDPLMRGILERLAISEAVARTKFASGKPVQDTPREQALLDSVGERASQYGLTAPQARTFFRLQIEAGKLVQTALLARWAREGRAPGQPVDLATRLRPALDRLGVSLMHDLGRLCALPDDPTRLARIHQARERIAKAAKLEALQRAAFDEATSGLCLSAPPRIWTLSMAQ
ncbi:gamma subclass chorismate mutase AroQ [Pandoraea pneumonica]|uniref:gamma subclass chorismate mutase AroQ n=1 Tax=Pandoraea pneumonica TaxID=2508299 RepID=UPI003CF508ED